MKRIEPKVLKGFRDILPQDEYKRRALIRKLEEQFALFSYLPIDTPALEYTEILLGKGGGETDKQIFRFQDQGGRDVALRFDLTVPFARFMAQNGNNLALPFKRYHIGKAWRGEKPQRGRFREFYQCDCDIVGVDSASADIEILTVMYESLRAIGITNYTIHFSHRGLFNQFLEGFGSKETQEAILRSVDKMRKVGEEKTRNELIELAGKEGAEKIISWITPGTTFADTIQNLENLTGGASEASERLTEVFRAIEDMGYGDSFILDPSITRGLDYYTGIVFETFLNDLPSIGSIYSGGRYNNLASLYTKQELPGVGCSIGLDRTLAALEVLQKGTSQEGKKEVLVLMPEDYGLLSKAHGVAKELREAGISAEVYHRKKKYGVQFKYAEERNIPYALIISDEKNYTLKEIASRESYDLSSTKEVAAKITGRN